MIEIKKDLLLVGGSIFILVTLGAVAIYLVTIPSPL